MTSIETLKNKYYELLRKEYCNKQNTPEEISNIDAACRAVAEVKAYTEVIITDDNVRDKTISDITGITNKGKQVLSLEIARKAKDAVCEYCWGKDWDTILKRFKDNNDVAIKYMKEHSILPERLKNGVNVVIFGSSDEVLGKSMIASIILKEAIRLRMFVPGVRGHTYHWVNYSSLRSALIENADDIAIYKTCEWLVIDGIIWHDLTDGHKAFLEQHIDPFFIERYKNKLPTILVFQFDIRQGWAQLQKQFGMGIHKIVSDPRTCQIALSKEPSTLQNPWSVRQ